MQIGIARDVGIVDCYRYYDGAQYRGAFPIIVEFKQRREKEQLLWRSKDKLRKINVVVTDDVSLRQKQTDEEDTRQSSNKKTNTASPKKKQKEKPSPQKALFGDVDYFKALFNI